MGGDLGIDRLKHTYRWPGVASGCIARSRIHTQRPNGDRVLLDFANRFFALSDSSDRDPESSKRCLLSFAGIMAAWTGHPRPANGGSPADLENLRREVAAQAEALLGRMKGTAACTFTGIRILDTPGGRKGLLLHTGDSALYRCNPRHKRMAPLTRSNFWLVGRTDRLFQLDWIDLGPEPFLLLTTDGIPDPTRSLGQADREAIAAILFGAPIDEVAHRMIDAAQTGNGLRDDAAVLAIAPQRLPTSGHRILLEGA